MVILAQFYTLSQTSEVWIEQRGDSIVYVMSESKGQDVADKLIQLHELRDSVQLLMQKVDVKDSLILNLNGEIFVLKRSNDRCDEINQKKDQQISNHVEMEGILNDTIKAQKRRKWLFGIVGFSAGFITGVILK